MNDKAYGGLLAPEFEVLEKAHLKRLREQVSEEEAQRVHAERWPQIVEHLENNPAYFRAVWNLYGDHPI